MIKTENNKSIAPGTTVYVICRNSMSKYAFDLEAFRVTKRTPLGYKMVTLRNGHVEFFHKDEDYFVTDSKVLAVAEAENAINHIIAGLEKEIRQLENVRNRL